MMKDDFTAFNDGRKTAAGSPASSGQPMLPDRQAHEEVNQEEGPKEKNDLADSAVDSTGTTHSVAVLVATTTQQEADRARVSHASDSYSYLTLNDPNTREMQSSNSCNGAVATDFSVNSVDDANSASDFIAVSAGGPGLGLGSSIVPTVVVGTTAIAAQDVLRPNIAFSALDSNQTPAEKKNSFLIRRQLPTHGARSSFEGCKSSDSQELEEEDTKPAASTTPSPFDTVQGMEMTSGSLSPTAVATLSPPEIKNTFANSNKKGQVASTPKKRRGSKSTSMAATSSDEGQSTGRWTDAEHQAFLRGLHQYGREWKKVASGIPTRSSAQVRSHAQKYFSKMQRDQEAFMVLAHASGTSTLPAAAAAANLQALAANAPAPSGGAPFNLTAIGEAAAGAGQDAASLESTIARILADPESVEAEVEETLQRLRERYNLLQQRLREMDSRSAQPDAGRSARILVPDPPSLPVPNARKRPAVEVAAAEVHAIPASQRGGAEASLSSAETSTLQDEELIALSVLHGALPRSGDSATGGSHNTEDCSTSATSHEEDKDDDTTASGSKRTKTADDSSSSSSSM